MANLVKCTGCGKKFSKNVPECPNCGAIYFVCKKCEEPIAPHESFFVDTNTTTAYETIAWLLKGKEGLHLSCSMPQSFNSKKLKCIDCGHSVRYQNFSLDSFLVPLRSVPCLRRYPHAYTLLQNWWKFLKIVCSNCGNPYALGSPQPCYFCKLPIIPAIHKYQETNENNYSGRRHSFCSIDRMAMKSMIKSKGWFWYWWDELLWQKIYYTDRAFTNKLWKHKGLLIQMILFKVYIPINIPASQRNSKMIRIPQDYFLWMFFNFERI